MNYRLREIEKKDIPIINGWRNKKDLIDFLGAPFRYINEDVDNNWYASYLSNRNSCVRLAIEESSSNVIVGAVYLTSIDWLNRSAEFSIWIGLSEHQNKGVGKFATHKILDHAFKDLGLHRIYLTVLERNARARKLYKSVGFSEEGVLRQAVFKNGCYENMVSMSILMNEFKHPD